MIALAPLAMSPLVEASQPLAKGPARLIDALQRRGVVPPTRRPMCDRQQTDEAGSDVMFGIQDRESVTSPINVHQQHQTRPSSAAIGQKRRIDGNRASASDAHSQDELFGGFDDAPTRSSSSSARDSETAMETLRVRNRSLRGKLTDALRQVADLKTLVSELQARAENAESERAVAEATSQKWETETAELRAQLHRLLTQRKTETAQFQEALEIRSKKEAEAAQLGEELSKLKSATDDRRNAAREATELMIAATPTPGRAGAGAKRKPSKVPVVKKTQQPKPPVPAFAPCFTPPRRVDAVVKPPVPPFAPCFTPPRKVDPAVRLRQMPLRPKRPEDNVEIRERKVDEDVEDGDEADEEIIEKSEEEDDQPIPKWCDTYLEVLVAQDNLDPDTIFGARVPRCNLDAVFTQDVYDQVGLPRQKRRRGSSGEWGEDRLGREEVETYKARMGHRECWESLMARPSAQ